MFYRYTKDFSFYLRRQEYKFILDETNILKKRIWSIIKLRRLMGRANFNNYVFYIFKQWINHNFAYTQEFIRKFHRIVRKYGLNLTTGEREFIYNIEEVNFALWRPIKELPIVYRFELKEKCYFKNSGVNLHSFTVKTQKVTFINRGDLILTNKSILLIDNETDQNILDRFEYAALKKIMLSKIGVQFSYQNKTYLLRHNNHALIYALLYRILGKKVLNFDLNQLPDSLYWFNLS